ncbi:hypothetical protein FE784_21775 [Paenibacillus hemerocallicola]|uniref:Uncharacterized protein n=1 Tax=Paenibacillus hemerocallicola TaxID=1172614 RepID=A0A5C4T643_9BACL|nr:hypothetical protein [Paenibacillus hemerocallicola]TNJ64100.1 hypothetical protein FE784_21775 [Paenibacillus hemerocallicola]
MNAILPIDHERLLLERVKDWEAQYNPDLKLLRTPFSSPGYHTTLKNADFVHGTYVNLIYALALLDTALPEYERRAFDIIETIVELQDTDRSRHTFGIWPWFYEEPLERMSPPDWNWADFCGKQLLLALFRHGPRFPAPLRERVKQAVCHACDAIIKRDVGPTYTNIAIMGALVTLIAGEHLGIGAYAEYGENRLGKFHEFTFRLKAFQEYNSPTYAVVSVLELSRIRTMTVSERAERMSGELLELAWEMIAAHAHARTGEWSGPHSRSYRTLLGAETKSFLQVSTGGQIGFVPQEKLHYSAEWYGSGLACPERLFQRFVESRTETVRQLYMSDPQRGLEKWATTYMTPQYAIGTFSQEILWNQCRNLVGYFDNGGSPAYIHLRFLHDGYDYSSAVFSSVQNGPDIAFGIRFMTDGGDTHPNLDKTGGTIEASDLRLRLETGGCLERVTGNAEGEAAELQIGGISVKLKRLFAAFHDGKETQPTPEWSLKQEDDRLCLDFVLYEGERRTFDFRTIESAAFLFALSVGKSIPDYDVDFGTEYAAVGFPGDDASLRLELPLKPTGGL